MKRLEPHLMAFVFSYREAIIHELQDSYIHEIEPFFKQAKNQQILQGGESLWTPLNSDYYIVSYSHYPLIWISNNNHRTYQIFERIFKQMELQESLKKVIDFENHLTLFCGFIVMCYWAPFHFWHVDFFPEAHSFTLLSPLFPLASEHGHLDYLDGEKKIKTYQYKSQEAILVGEKFVHSTQPFKANGKLRILFSMTFGTDKLIYWESIKKTIEKQSMFYALPCGHYVNTCDCLRSM